MNCEAFIDNLDKAQDCSLNPAPSFGGLLPQFHLVLHGIFLYLIFIIPNNGVWRYDTSVVQDHIS